MMVIRDLNIFNSTFEISTPSIIILPSAASTILNRLKVNEDFPAPVLPTMPIYKKKYKIDRKTYIKLFFVF